MPVSKIISKIRSGVCKIEFYKEGKLVNSGTGFICNDKLLTNSHVFHPGGIIFSGDTEIKLIFGDNKTINTNIDNLNLITGSEERNGDFAIYDYDFSAIGERFNFELSNLEEANEGDEIMVFGFPFDASYLTSHRGIISAFFKENSINKIQIDASINNGNSGGPLFHLKTGKVIGIVTRKQTGLERDFDTLIENFSKNIKLLDDANRNGGAVMLGINIISVFRTEQLQMQIISRNIKRSSNTGIGYAFSCEAILDILKTD